MSDNCRRAIIFIYVKNVGIMFLKFQNLFYLPQETNEIVAIKKFKDSEGKMPVNQMKLACLVHALCIGSMKA